MVNQKSLKLEVSHSLAPAIMASADGAKPLMAAKGFSFATFFRLAFSLTGAQESRPSISFALKRKVDFANEKKVKLDSCLRRNDNPCLWIHTRYS